MGVHTLYTKNTPCDNGNQGIIQDKVTMITSSMSNSKKKRHNENGQVRKEVWDEMNNDTNDENKYDSFKVASHQELNQRRIVRASYTSPAQRVNFGSTVAAAGNPFGSIQLSTTAEAASSKSATPLVNKNPFAMVSLTAPNPASSIMSNNNNNNLKLLQQILNVSQYVLESVVRDPFTHISFPSIFITEGEIEIEKAALTRTSANANAQSSSLLAMPFQSGGATSIPKPVSAFPAPAVVKTSSVFAGFSFGTPTTTNNHIKHDDQPKTRPMQALNNNSSSSSISRSNGFSLIPPASNNVTASVNGKAEGEDEEFQKQEAEVAQRECNDDEDTLYEARVKHYKLISSNEWKPFGTGILRVMQSKTNPKKGRRMVLRSDVIGTVQLNVGIGKGMPFSKESQKNGTGFIRFVNPADNGRYMFKVKDIATLDELHSKLTELAK